MEINATFRKKTKPFERNEFYYFQLKVGSHLVEYENQMKQNKCQSGRKSCCYETL